MKARLVRPWILFPYKSLKSEIALTLKLLLLTLKLQEVANFKIFLHVMQTINFIHVCVRYSKGTPFCIGSIVMLICTLWFIFTLSLYKIRKSLSYFTDKIPIHKSFESHLKDEHINLELTLHTLKTGLAGVVCFLLWLLQTDWLPQVFRHSGCCL